MFRAFALIRQFRIKVAMGLTQNTLAASRIAGWRPSDQREQVVRIVRHFCHLKLTIAAMNLEQT
ncbi:MAG: hypothetical protein ACRDBI_02910, partial [Shewanella sp.]